MRVDGAVDLGEIRDGGRCQRLGNDARGLKRSERGRAREREGGRRDQGDSH